MGRRTTYGPSIAQTTVDTSGPIFEPDATKTYFENVRAMLQAVADEGTAAVRLRIPFRTGKTQAGVQGRVKSLQGRPWYLTAVVSEYPDDRAAMQAFPWRNKGARGFEGRGEAIYRGGRLEARLHMYRRVASQLRQSVKVAMADLTKGLN